MSNETLVQRLANKVGIIKALHYDARFLDLYERKSGTPLDYCMQHDGSTFNVGTYFRRQDAVKHRYFNKVEYELTKQGELKLQ